MGNCVVSANNQLRMSALQVTTTVIAMASEKYIRWLKVTNWQSTDLEIKINKYMAIWSNSQTFKGWWHNMKCAPIDMIFFGNHFTAEGDQKGSWSPGWRKNILVVWCFWYWMNSFSWPYVFHLRSLYLLIIFYRLRGPIKSRHQFFKIRNVSWVNLARRRNFDMWGMLVWDSKLPKT